MTTASTNTPIDHSTDAAFRVWLTEFLAQLTAIGLTNTADTGQINTSTATRPGGTSAFTSGYSIWRFNDTAQSSSPIFLKFEFGNGGATTTPGLRVTLGQGSNGTGTLTGTLVGPYVLGASTALTSTVINYVSRFCYDTATGCFWFGFKYNGSGLVSGNAAVMGLLVVRSCDSTGAPTTDSVNMVVNNNSATSTVTSSGGFVTGYSWLTSAALTPSNGYSPGATSQSGGVLFNKTTLGYLTDIQVLPWLIWTPRIQISGAVATYLLVDVSLYSTATSTLVGSSSHTFMAAGVPFATTISFGGFTNFGFYLPWE